MKKTNIFTVIIIVLLLIGFSFFVYFHYFKREIPEIGGRHEYSLYGNDLRFMLYKAFKYNDDAHTNRLSTRYDSTFNKEIAYGVYFKETTPDHAEMYFIDKAAPYTSITYFNKGRITEFYEPDSCWNEKSNNLLSQLIGFNSLDSLKKYKRLIVNDKKQTNKNSTKDYNLKALNVSDSSVGPAFLYTGKYKGADIIILYVMKKTHYLFKTHSYVDSLYFKDVKDSFFHKPFYH